MTVLNPSIATPRCPKCGFYHLLSHECQSTAPAPSPFLQIGCWINSNLPTSLGIGMRVDPMLPEGTIEVWQDGKRIGRIENIGIR
jgi:hypothetical protein